MPCYDPFRIWGAVDDRCVISVACYPVVKSHMATERSSLSAAKEGLRNRQARLQYSTIKGLYDFLAA